MTEITVNKITSTEIKHFEKDFSGLLILPLEEYCSKYEHIIRNPHRILFYEMFLIAAGEGRIKKDSDEYKYFSKSFFAVSKGQVATLEFMDVPKGYAVIFTEEFINRNPGDFKWLNTLNLFDLSIDIPVASLSEVEYYELQVLSKKIKTELELKNDLVAREIVFNLLKTFILIAERLSTGRMNCTNKEAGGQDYVFEFKQKLEAMFNNSRTVNYYADQLGITPRKLNQVTFNFCGISAKQLIEDRVLLETKRLLIHTHLTIKEIGHSLGFNDPTNFNKFFKRYIKQTPLEFRELNRKTDKSNKTADNDHFQRNVSIR